MKVLSVLLAAVFLSSCVHTAIAPVANEQGVPVVIRIPGVKAGQTVKAEHLAAIDKKVTDGMFGKIEGGKQDPNILEAGPVGFFGDVTTRNGDKFVGYLPMILIRSTYPPEAVDRVAGQLAAGYYRSAKKHYQVTPITSLKSKPSTKKP